MATLFVSFRSRLFGCFLVVAALTLITPAFFVRPILQEALLNEAMDRLHQEALLVQGFLEGAGGRADAAALAVMERSKIRFTLIDAKGAVMLDSGVTGADDLDSHADRPEVMQAMQTGFGGAIRYSSTLQTELVYAALRLNDGAILRLATPFAGVRQRIDAQMAGFSLAAGPAIALSLLLAWYFSHRLEKSLSDMVRVVEGISMGHFSRRLHAVPGAEFRPLAGAVNRMAKSIGDFVHTESDQKGQLEAILETMAEGVLVLGPRGRIRRANRALAELFPSAAGLMGGQVVEVIPSPALQDAVISLLADMEGLGKTTALQIEPRPGKIFPVLLARPPREAAHAIGAVAVFRDISELMRLETVRRDFVANVSHELRTPLTAIQGYAETLMEMDEVPAQGRRFAEIIRKHGIFLSALVDELLTLSRLENDNAAVRRENIDPRQALNAAKQMLTQQIEQARLRISEDLAPDLRVLTDGEHLEQVFRNLLENSCRYAPPESDIVVRMRPLGEEALFSVSDQGPGIPPGDLGRVFERFYQVEKHRNYAGGSSAAGLGLAICKHIIERHSGRIWAESPAPDAATSFFFTLPLAVAGDLP
ncbi:MAG: PAS domain S-box protein [Deltaproteobacteria bacterium]|jgi:two-component system phosphate regulon sensor histidine kinase PhoR|nr:PAS domain S-box protein [Deltaproteobacteria bacterium]